MSLQEIQNYISTNQINRAFREFKELTKNTHLNKMVLNLEHQFNDLEEQKMMGMITVSDAKVQSARIINGLHSLIEKYEEEIIDNNSQPKDTIKEEDTNAKANSTNIRKILFLYSSPSNKSELRFSEEIRAIEDALQIGNRNEEFEIVAKGMVQGNEVAKILRRENPHFLHISTHASKKKGLLFEDKNRQEQPITSDAFAGIIKRLTSRENNLECIVLNACNSLAHAEAIKEMLPFTVGTQDFIPDEAAIEFTKTFYETIFDGEDIEFAFEDAQGAIQIAGVENPDGDIPCEEIPVLFQKQ